MHDILFTCDIEQSSDTVLLNNFLPIPPFGRWPGSPTFSKILHAYLPYFASIASYFQSLFFVLLSLPSLKSLFRNNGKLPFVSVFKNVSIVNPLVATKLHRLSKPVHQKHERG